MDDEGESAPMRLIRRWKEFANRPLHYNAFVLLGSLTFCLAYNRNGLVERYGLFGLAAFGDCKLPPSSRALCRRFVSGARRGEG